MEIGSDQWLTAEKVIQKPIVAQVIGFEKRLIQSKDRKKNWENIIIVTDHGKINSWDCYKVNLEVGNLIKLECADVNDKLTLIVLDESPS